MFFYEKFLILRADHRHFDFVHNKPLKWLDCFKFEWTMLSERASEAGVIEIMRHRKAFVNDFKMKLLNKYITEENKPFVNVIGLDCYMQVFRWRFFCFNVTGLQVGPAMVYLFIKSRLFELRLEQSIVPADKFLQQVTHKIFASPLMPYWFSAYLLYNEVQQLTNDMLVWNNKVFGSTLAYNMKTSADRNLNSWRNWYYQFYEGCHEFEKQKMALDW